MPSTALGVWEQVHLASDSSVQQRLGPKSGFTYCAWKIFSLLQTHVTLTDRPEVCHLHLSTLVIQSAYALLWNPSLFQVWMWTSAPTRPATQSPSTAICSMYTEAGWLFPFSHTTLHNSTYHSITITMVIINMNMQIWGWQFRSVTKCFS